MEKFNELLEKLNKLNLTQKTIDWEENLPVEIWEEYFEKNYKDLKCNISPDARRWYETSITVIQIYDSFLGIEHITQMYSESSSCEDCYFKMKFFEMKEVKIVSYEKKATN